MKQHSFTALNQSLFSPNFSPIPNLELKKGREGFVVPILWSISVEHRIITAPFMIITMIIVMIPYMTVVFEAKSVSGVAAGELA
jgi:hypothetical protein